MYNEEAGVADCVTAICRILDQVPGRTSLIGVNDGSRAGTGGALAQHARTHPRVVVVSYEDAPKGRFGFTSVPVLVGDAVAP